MRYQTFTGWIAQATIQNTNTTKRDFVLKIKAFKYTVKF